MMKEAAAARRRGDVHERARLVGGTAAKPVGLVHFAAASRGGSLIHHERHFGDIGRGAVRRLSVLEALAMLTELAKN